MSPLSINIAELTQSSQAMKDYTLMTIVGTLTLLLWQIGIVFVFLQSGMAAHLAKLVEKDSKSQFVRAATYTGFLFLYIFALTLPAKVLFEFCPDKMFGLSMDTAFSYMLTKTIEFISSLFHAVPILAIAMVLIKRFPRQWGYYTGILLAVAYILQTLLLPKFLEDNSGYLRALDKPEVQARVDSVLKKAGLEGAKVLVEDVPQSKKLNAYVTGAGPSARFVLYDSVVKKLTAAEIESMIAHEVAHIKLNHLQLSLGLCVFFLFLVPITAQYMTPYLVKKFPQQWGVQKPEDLSFLAVAALSVFCVTFVAMPIVNCFSRQIEFQADREALALTGDPEAFAKQLASYARSNLDDMNPPSWAVFLLYSHPSVKDRIEAVLKPES